MEEFQIPEKLINMCKTCVQKTRNEVGIEGTLSSFFKIKHDWNRLTISNTIQLSITKSDVKYKNGS